MSVMSVMQAVMNCVMLHVSIHFAAVTLLVAREHRVRDGLHTAVRVEVAVVQLALEPYS